MNPTPDITQHPLYRPHHGDMTGWRYLERNEVIDTQDECIATSWSDWDTCISRVGCRAGEFNQMVFRRRISPESKPADKKRFVTIAVEVLSEETISTVSALLQSYKIQIREGNALAALDGIEDRAIEAVRQAVKGGRA